MNRIWKIKNKHPELSCSMASSLDISPITAQLLINRGIEDEMQAHHFLYGDFGSCHDPFLLKGIQKSIDRVNQAIKNKENILIYGDYDVDGITSVALLNIVLTHLGAKTSTYIPNRLEEGYGLNADAIKKARQKKISLIITVDCGISAHKEIEFARRLGIDTIITDHHEIKKDDLPFAFSIINPLQKGCYYPFKQLSGVGIAYKFAQALLKETSYPIETHLDLVALGTISDLSVQKGENRILTKCGLNMINRTENEGIKALIEVAGLKSKTISCMHVGYILGPRINAMGRVGSPDIALQLLLTKDKEEALNLARTLHQENRNRQKIEARVLNEALDKIEREINFKDSKVIVLSGDDWHLGVIGIVASRIIDKFYRPTIVIGLNGKIGKGSGRSIDNFHLFNAINLCSKHLIDFGGHESACGLVINKKDINKFTSEINLVAKKTIADEDLYPTIDIDAEVTLSDLTEKFLTELELLAPFGPENPKPVFFSGGAYLKNDPRRISKNGFKMWVSDDKATCEAISFRGSNNSMPFRGAKVGLVYSPSINIWQGLSSVQLDLKDFKMEL